MSQSLWRWAIAGLCLWPSTAFAQSTASLCPATLPAAIDAIAQRPEFQRVHWGMVVQPLHDGAPLFAHAADQYFIPASNAKLFVTAAALLKLGPDYRLRTSLVQTDSPSSETVLRLVGGGDPSFGDAQVAQLAQQLLARGLTHIDHLILDQQTFAGSPINPNWEWEDVQAGYGAPATSLMLNQNAIALTLAPQALGQPLRVIWDDPTEGQNWQIDNQSRTVGAEEPEFVEVGRAINRPVLTVSGQLRAGAEPEPVAIAIPDPDTAILRRVQRIFRQQGITIRRVSVANSALPSDAVEVAAVDAPPLIELITEANQESTNLYAEALLRVLGTLPPVSASSSVEQGIEAIDATLAPGVDPSGYALVDGSGLARQNLATPTALVETLQTMAQSPLAQPFRTSLSQAGVVGTLRNRFRDTPLEGQIWGKTGAMTGVAALSGYVDPPNYEPLAISLLVNHFDRPVREIRPVMDEMVLTLARLQPCTTSP